LHIFVKKRAMKSKSMASRQYAANQFGMTDGPKRPKKGRSGEKGQDMSCSKDGCATFNTGGGKSNVGRETNRQNKGGAKGLSMKAKYSKQVLNERQIRRAQKENEKIRAKAPARPMTRLESQKANEMRPSRQDYNDNNVPRVSSARPAPKPAKKGVLGKIFKPRKTQKITI